MKHKTGKNHRRLRRAKVRCLHCQHPGFDHIAWTSTGRPWFQCQGCGDVWACGFDGEPFYSAAQSHPRSLIVANWTEADYAKVTIRQLGNRLCIKQKNNRNRC